MHLALLLASESEQLIRTFAPNVQDLHLTVIHSKQTLPSNLPLPIVILPLTGTGYKIGLLGSPKKRVQVIELVSDPFWELRRQTEQILSRRYISWSKGFPFVPHVSLGPIAAHNLRLPIQLTFDRLVWR